MKSKSKYYAFFVSAIVFGVLLFIFKSEFYNIINATIYDNPVKIGNVLIHYKGGLAYDKDSNTVVLYDQIDKRYNIYCNSSFGLSSSQTKKFSSFVELKHNFKPIMDEITINKIRYIKVEQEGIDNNYTSFFWAPEKQFLCEYYGVHDSYSIFLKIIEEIEFLSEN